MNVVIGPQCRFLKKNLFIFNLKKSDFFIVPVIHMSESDRKQTFMMKTLARAKC